MRCDRSTLPFQSWRCGFDVDVADPAVHHVPVELGLELSTVVRLDLLDLERQLLEHVVEELDCCELVVLG